MNTKRDEIFNLMKERLLQIKKGNTCHVNNSVYDVTVDQVILDICDFQNRKKKVGLNILIESDECEITEHFGNKRTETYNVNVKVEYVKGKDCSDSDYQLYFDHLHHWIYILLSDASGTINSFWRQIHTKSGMLDFSWKVEHKNPPKSFNGVISIPNLQIQNAIDTMFI